MRGAALVDIKSGQRLEPDTLRGIRVSRMDVDPDAKKRIDTILGERNLHHPRVIEAWTLASKVAIYPQIVAELCWSDAPDYVAGYVASAQNGYQRITHLKQAGSLTGGRIFFVKPQTDIDSLIDRLQFEPVLFTEPMMDHF